MQPLQNPLLCSSTAFSTVVHNQWTTIFFIYFTSLVVRFLICRYIYEHRPIFYNPSQEKLSLDGVLVLCFLIFLSVYLPPPLIGTSAPGCSIYTCYQNTWALSTWTAAPSCYQQTRQHPGTWIEYCIFLLPGKSAHQHHNVVLHPPATRHISTPAPVSSTVSSCYQTHQHPSTWTQYPPATRHVSTMTAPQHLDAVPTCQLRTWAPQHPDWVPSCY